MEYKRTIRPATDEDVPRILVLLKMGLAQMRADGNVNQWHDTTHSFDTILADIARGESFVVAVRGCVQHRM